MTVNSDDFREAFFQECEDLLEGMNDGFQLMADAAHDDETVHGVFRAVHSVKGGAGAFGLDGLVAFAHEFETALDRLRSGAVELDGDLLSLFQRSGDHLADLVCDAREGLDRDNPATGPLREELATVIGDIPQDEDEIEFQFAPLALELEEQPDSKGPARYRIAFQARPGLYDSGNEPALIFKALSGLGHVSVRADVSDIPCLPRLDADHAHTRWTLTLDSHAPRSAVEEAFEFVEGLCDLAIAEEREDTEAAGARSVDAAPGADTDRPAQPADRAAPPAGGKDAGRMPGHTTIRVDLDRVDKLINLVGELVIKEAMMSQSIVQMGVQSESDVAVGLDGLKQLASEIQEGVMEIRAQPVKSLFQRMSRIVREAAGATQKRVRLVTQGQHTEIDKTVLERLVDPLTHMIRNSVDHGLETPDTRRKAGKPEEGTVILSAAHRSGRVIIELSDDGAGIDRSRVAAVAEEKGLIQPGADLHASEIDNLLFLPGFSSKDEISSLSGRGVGLDVVRSEVHALGGRITIASDPGEGTTFTIVLPLTLAVLEGMVIEIAGQSMIIPISAIQETLQPKAAEVHDLGRTGRIVANRGEFIPLIDLAEFFGFRPPSSEFDQQVLLLLETDGNQRCAVIVDRIQDQRQVVIKSLERNYGSVPGIAAATILGDGRISLIMDPEAVARDSCSQLPKDFNLAAAE